VARSRHGKIGEKWWSRRFVAILESFAMGPRLARGKRYARSGQVLDLKVAPGIVRARVQGSRSKPYLVEIGVPPLSTRAWQLVEEAMVARARFVAQLLNGEMPADIEEAFEASHRSLFPKSRRELSSSCSCPDDANPCKHIAAVYYILAERFDEEPFDIFLWRGRSRDKLMESLKEKRAVAVKDIADEITEPETEPGLEAFWSLGGDLGELHYRPYSPDDPGGILRRLGLPPAEVGGPETGVALRRMYAAFTRAAERRAAEGPDRAGA
jgi:uncharacterized Zn finger protein